MWMPYGARTLSRFLGRHLHGVATAVVAHLPSRLYFFFENHYLYSEYLAHGEGAHPQVVT